MRMSSCLGLFCAASVISALHGEPVPLTRDQPPEFFEQRGISLYASMDAALDADYANGRARPIEPLFPAAYKDQKHTFEPGKFGNCIRGASMTLIYDAMKNFVPDRGGVSFWFMPHDRDIWTYFKVESREVGVGPNSRRQMDLYFSTFLFGSSPILREGFHRALIRPAFDAIDAQFTLDELSRDEWHHFAWTWDNTAGMRVMVDGKVVFDNWGTTTWIQMMTPNLIVLRSIKACDEFMLFRRPLSLDEMSGLHQGKLPEPQPEATEYSLPPEVRRDIAHSYGLDELPAYPNVVQGQPKVINPVNYVTAKDGKRPMLLPLDGNRVSCWPISHIEIVNTDELTITYPPKSRANYFKVIADDIRFSVRRDDDARPFWVDEVRPEIDSWEEKIVRRYVADEPLTFDRLTLDRKGARIGEFYVYDIHDGALQIPGTTSVDMALTGMADVRTFETIGGRYQLYHNHPSPSAIATKVGTSLDGTLNYGALIPFHLVTEPAEAQTGIAVVSLRLALNQPLGRQNDIVRIRIPDPITKERDLIHVDLRLQFDPAKEGPQVFDLAFDVPDIVLNKDARLWVWLVSKTGGQMNLQDSQLTLHTVSATKAGEEMTADTLRLLQHSYMTSSEPHQWSRAFKFPGDEIYHYAWSDWAGLYNLIKEGIAADHKIAGIYWNTIRPKKRPGYKVNEEAVALPYRQPEAPESIPNPTGAPEWALYQNGLVKVFLRIGQWWHDNRLVPETGVIGGYGDDTQYTGEIFWLYFTTGDEKVLNTIRAVSEGSWKFAGWTRGFPSRTNDIGHNAEEVSGAFPLMVLADYGNPKYIEWIMECMSLLDFLTVKTEHGHRHFKSWYYSANEIITEGALGVDTFGNSSFTIIGHPLAWYNRNPKLVGFYKDWCDAWLEDIERARKAGFDKSFTIKMPEDIPSEHRHHRPYTMPHQFMVTGLLTGEQKYIDRALRNDDSVFERYYRQWGEGMVYRDFGFLRHMLKEDERLSKSRTATRPAFTMGKFLKTGDRSVLAQDFKRVLLRYISDLEYMYTEGQPSLDRLWGLNNEPLYLSMLGGRPAGHRDTSNWPGLAISYTDAAGDLASLVLDNRTTKAEFVVWNFNTNRNDFGIRLWQLEPGKYEMKIGVEGSDAVVTKTLMVRRGTRVRLPLPSGKLWHVRFVQTEKIDEPELLPDLAMGPDDVRYDTEEQMLRVTVHNVGTANASAFQLELSDGNSVVASKRLDGLEAAVDFVPRTVTVEFNMTNASYQRLKLVTIRHLTTVLEITDENDSVALGE